MHHPILLVEQNETAASEHRRAIEFGKVRSRHCFVRLPCLLRLLD